MTRPLPDTAMVFAAGRGTRMRHLTADRPKALVEAAGRPLIDHALDLLAEGGVPRAVVNVHHHGAQLLDHLARRSAPATEISDERAALLETGGGMRHARSLLGEAPVWALNADAVWEGRGIAAALGAAWAAAPADTGAVLLLVPRARAVGHPGQGDFFMDADGRLALRGADGHAPLVYTGFQIIDPAPVYAHGPGAFSLLDTWRGLIAEGRLYGAIHDARWCDVGQPESLPLAAAMVAGR